MIGPERENFQTSREEWKGKAVMYIIIENFTTCANQYLCTV